MTAADRFEAAARLAVLALVDHLASTGKGHATRAALLAALRGHAPFALRDDFREHIAEFGVFATLPIRWVEERLDAVCDEGLLERMLDTPARHSHEAPLQLSASGRSALAASVDEAVPLLGRSATVHSRPTPQEQATRDALTALRATIGREEGRPAFSILPNRTLDELARRRPTDLGALAAVHGMGEARLARHGRRILRAIARAGRKGSR